MSKPVPVNEITAMSLRFAVNWSIYVRQLRNITSDENAVLKSNYYQFENIKDLRFSCKLFYEEGYKMRVENMGVLPVYQDDALILIKDRVYRVQCNTTNTLGRLVCNPDDLPENSYEDPKVTFHCIMSVPAGVQAVIPYLDMGPLAVNHVECELINLYIDPDRYDAVSEFAYSGKIPDFNVKMAVSMIGEAHKRQNFILKALCSEYLMENLTSENVAEVLKQSVDSDAKHLSQNCVDFLSKQCKISSI